MPSTRTLGGLLASTAFITSLLGMDVPDGRALRQAKSKAATHPLLDTMLSRAHADRGSLGLGSFDELRIQNVQTSPEGSLSWRFNHHFRGLRVAGSHLVHLTNASGNVLETLDDLAGSVPLLFDTTPRVSEAEAKGRVGESHPFQGPAKAELLIWPETRLIHRASGKPYSGEAGEWNAADFRREVSGYRLAWCIDAEEVQPGGRRARGMRTYVDAHTGETIKRHGLGNEDTPTKLRGTSSYPFPNIYSLVCSKYVDLDGSIDGSGRIQLIDQGRNFKVMDDDYGDNSVPNITTSTSTYWGDGMKFAGDAGASMSNRRTHMVNVKYSLQAVWDMFANVFHRKGPDGNSYSVNAYVHYDTDWMNAEYYTLTGNIHVGDGGGPKGEWLTAVDTLAHEWGHALTDFTSNLDSNGSHTESGGLNEGNSDIVGALTRMYVYNRNLETPYGPDPFITDNGADTPTMGPIVNGAGIDYWTLSCNRRFRNPGIPAWYPDIAQLDEHDSLGPLDRAFYFMVRGASSDPTNVTFSPLLPTGSKGLGANKAAKIYLDAATHRFTGSEDYAKARLDVVASATAMFGATSEEAAAVRNAFAGVGVGSVDASYVHPPLIMETTATHNTWSTAQLITPLSGDAAGRKVIHGTGKAGDHDCYRIQVPYGRGATLTLVPVFFMGDYSMTQMAQVIETGTPVNLASFGQSFGVVQSLSINPLNFSPGTTTDYDVNIYTEQPSMRGVSTATYGKYRLVIDRQ